MTSKRIWHSGPPPHVGWWNASTMRNPELWRWWNGEVWSLGVTAHRHFSLAVRAASRASRVDPNHHIAWTDYWPEGARVPRIDPRVVQSAAPAVPDGDVVVSWNEADQIVAVTRQDDDGRILSVIAESAAPVVREPFTKAQLHRLYVNSPEFHKDAPSEAAFTRIVQLAEQAHGITAPGSADHG